MAEEELRTYRRCISQQLEELEMLSSIYCAPGELQMLDAGVVADFNEFIEEHKGKLAASLLSHLEYVVKLSLPAKQSVEVRVELPHLYPILEQARVSVHTPLLGKCKEQRLKIDMEQYQSERREEDAEPYIFQLLSWLQEYIEYLLKRPASEFVEQPAEPQDPPQPAASHLERMWIYSHHIKSTAKRQELIRQARQLQLTGFSRPGKPGIICVEGESGNVQEFWRTIKALRWQKISLVRTEPRQRKRGFEDFSEQLFNAEEGVMNMGQFIRFLEAHGFGYMKSELFGLD
ncbi:RWD domain-containing protein 2A [Drosophila rhopaloa]|uniref:RWD domain-containing protein 2A n=1 Tax=Drosophila rhopaloa TaxID=1041015 RepID=A0A6P4EL34_DRORH|nr:RWD domain-containing protein 2A [Drosophila rhopaloa]